MIFEIKKYPAPVLKKRAKEIVQINQEVRELAENMIETMAAREGVGLAANQVGVLKRIIIVQTEGRPQVFINPRVIQKSRETARDQEGCLSLPKELYLNIKRAQLVEITALDLFGKETKIRVQGLAARIFQHEIDHINGTLIIDRIGFWQKLKIRKKIETLWG